MPATTTGFIYDFLKEEEPKFREELVKGGFRNPTPEEKEKIRALLIKKGKNIGDWIVDFLTFFTPVGLLNLKRDVSLAKFLKSIALPKTERKEIFNKLKLLRKHSDLVGSVREVYGIGSAYTPWGISVNPMELVIGKGYWPSRELLYGNFPSLPAKERMLRVLAHEMSHAAHDKLMRSKGIREGIMRFDFIAEHGWRGSKKMEKLADDMALYALGKGNLLSPKRRMLVKNVFKKLEEVDVKAAAKSSRQVPRQVRRVRRDSLKNSFRKGFLRATPKKVKLTPKKKAGGSF